MSISVLPNEKPNRTLSELEFLHNPDSKDARLGKGSFAHVKLVKEKATGTLLALKSVDVTLEKASKSDMHNLRTEILVHRELDHANIIKFHGYLQEEGRIYMLLDYAPKGNLYSYMHKNKNLPLEHVFKFFYQTCLAINYLHGKDILHRDIKPENLLLDKDLNIKLCDFGWAARSILDKRTTFCGTYEYMAPELVAKGTYNYKVDIWSLGILLYELFHSEAPYKGRSLQDIQTSMGRDTIHFNPIIQPELKDLILTILQKDPEQRPEIPIILNHPWIRNNLAKIDPAYKAAMATEVQQPDQQPSQSQMPRPQSASVKDQKPRGVSTPNTAGEDNSTVVKMSSFGLLQRQMSDNRDMVKENRDIKDSVNNGYMTPGHKTTGYPAKEIVRQNTNGYASPLIDKTAVGLSLSASQKNYSEGHVAQFQNDLSIKLAKDVNLQLGKAVKNGTKGMENEINMTPEKQQKAQELIQQSQLTRSYLQKRQQQQGSERSITKENMHAHNLSLIGFSQSSTGFNSTRHAYTTANSTYVNTNYENFSQAVSIPQGYKSATKANNNLSKDFSNVSISREPLSATSKPTRSDYSNDMQRSSNNSKANFGGRLKRDGVKLDVQRFYPFGGTNSSVSTNSPASASHTSFEVHSAGINYNKTSWGHQSKGSLNSSPYIFTRVDSDTRLNYNNSGSNSSYGSFSNNVYTFTQNGQPAYRGANSPVIERNVAKDVREGGYKVVRSNTQLDMRNYQKGAFLG